MLFSDLGRHFVLPFSQGGAQGLWLYNSEKSIASKYVGAVRH